MSLTITRTLTEEFDLTFYLEALEFTLVDYLGQNDLTYHKDNYYVYIYEHGYIEIHINDTVYSEMYGSWLGGFFIIGAYKDRCMELLKGATRKVKLQLLDTTETIESRYQVIKEKYIHEQSITEELYNADCKTRYPERFYSGPDGQVYYDDVDPDPDGFFDRI
jgi:hypothetical protein